MFNIAYDSTKNQINVKISDFTMKDVPQYVEEFHKVIEKVKPGFTGLTDLTQGKLFTQEVAAALRPLGELSIQKGMSKWAYVTGSAVAKMQMQRMFGEMVTAFETEEDAHLYLVR